METREKSEELTNSQTDLTLNENQPQAETVIEIVNEPEVAAPAEVVEVADEAPAEATAEAPEEVAAEATAEVAEATAEVTVEVAEEAAAEAAAEDLEPEVEVEIITVDAPEAEAEAEKEEPHAKAPATEEEALEVLAALAEKDADEISRDEVARLKLQFTTLHKATIQQELDAFVAAGNQAEAFTPAESENETKFKALLNTIKEKKAARQAETEAAMQANFQRKEELIKELAGLSEDVDNVNRQFPRFQEIQAEFKAIGEVPPTEMTSQWKRFQEAVERFYDQLKVNKDLRDYDFKKNLEIKTRLIEEAEKLAEDTDIVNAYKRMQDLHVNWRETGPVTKELREELWTRFKNATTVIYKSYQTLFEERKAREQANEAAKTALCERLEAIDLDSLNSFNAWNDMTKKVLEVQEEWRKLGFASKKVNNALFARFRALCDAFFARKAQYYQSVKEDYNANLAKKIALCEQAEALKDSTDWKKTADRLVAIQKEWREIGAVPKKQSDAVWARFQSACDYFFEQKKKDLKDTRSTEQTNLKAKKALVERLRNLAPDTAPELVLGAINEAQTEWKEIGHVPFREKDKVYEEFRAAINDLYKAFKLRESRNNMQRFETNLEQLTDENKLMRERERLARVLESKRNELTTAQNNIGFFNFKSAGSSSLLKEIERKNQRLRDDIADLEAKIRLIDEKL